MFSFNSNERRIAKLNRTQEGFTWLGKLSNTEIIEKYSEEIAVEQYGMELLLSYGGLYFEIEKEKEVKKHITDIDNDPPGNLRTQMISLLKQRLELSDTEKFIHILTAWGSHIEYWDYYLNIPNAKKSYDCYQIAKKAVLARNFDENKFVKDIRIGDANASIAPDNFMEKACDVMDEIVKNNIINKKVYVIKVVNTLKIKKIKKISSQ